MIIPARWFGGGKGLDSFRKDMIEDKRIRVLHDFLNASDCFGTGVEIKGGICYFLWNRDHPGKCKVFTHDADRITEQTPRWLKEENSDVFIRYQEGVSINQKVKAFGEESFDSLVSSRKPFGLDTSFHGEKRPFEKAIKLYERGGTGYIRASEIQKNLEWVNKYKVYISYAYNAGDNYPHQIIGKPILGMPGSACTETYLVIGPFESEAIAKNVISYISTKFFRCLVMLKKSSQHAVSSVYHFVPLQDFSEFWTDEKLYEKYNVSDKEVEFIDAMIKPMELGGDT